MYNCIFTPHCTELSCDQSCPMFVESSYLLERNHINMDSDVFRASEHQVNSMLEILRRCDGTLGSVVVDSSNTTFEVAELLTYCAICKNWKGSKLHCTVYNLQYSNFLDTLKQSWSSKYDPEVLEYTRIWSETSKVLIISNLDYVNFGDFESQTLLNLIQTRRQSKLTTIIVTPPIANLVSTKSSAFFNSLKTILIDATKVVKG